MIENYKLKDLLKFWKGQEKLNFQGIRVLLEIFEDKNVTKERKRWTIVAGLRGLGLYEIGYEKPKIEDILDDLDKQLDEKEKRNKEILSNDLDFGKRRAKVGIDTYKCKILNGTMNFWKIMN